MSGQKSRSIKAAHILAGFLSLLLLGSLAGACAQQKTEEPPEATETQTTDPGPVDPEASIQVRPNLDYPEFSEERVRPYRGELIASEDYSFAFDFEHCAILAQPREGKCITYPLADILPWETQKPYLGPNLEVESWQPSVYWQGGIQFLDYKNNVVFFVDCESKRYGSRPTVVVMDKQSGGVKKAWILENNWFETIQDETIYGLGEDGMLGGIEPKRCVLMAARGKGTLSDNDDFTIWQLDMSNLEINSLMQGSHKRYGEQDIMYVGQDDGFLRFSMTESSGRMRGWWARLDLKPRTQFTPEELCGAWGQDEWLEDGSAGERYLFFKDGSFLHRMAGQNDTSADILYQKGQWMLTENELTLIVEEMVIDKSYAYVERDSVGRGSKDRKLVSLPEGQLKTLVVSEDKVVSYVAGHWLDNKKSNSILWFGNQEFIKISDGVSDEELADIYREELQLLQELQGGQNANPTTGG